jgi:hypothetical protein
MAYVAHPEALGVNWGDIGSGVSRALDFFGQAQRSAGAQEALEAQARAAKARGESNGPHTATILLVSGIALTGLVAILLLRK